MSIFVIRLKAIKYKENSFCYLSSYPPDLGFETVCLLTLFFRLYAFRTFLFLMECIHLSKSSWISNLFYHLNPICWVNCWSQRLIFFAMIGLTKYLGTVFIAFNKPCLISLIWWFQKLKTSCKLKTLSCNNTSYWPRLGLAIKWPSYWFAIIRL